MILLRMVRLSRAEFALLSRALRLLASIRIALWLLPYSRVRHAFTSRQVLTYSAMSSERIVRFVDTASRCVPGATCLVRALAAEKLLRRYGHDACLRIGVSKGPSQALLAHAWVESGGRVMIGGEEAAGLTRLRTGGEFRP